MRFRYLSSLLLVFGLAILVAPSPSYAGPLQVKLVSNGITIVVIDNEFPDVSFGAGQIALAGPIMVGAWTLNSLLATGGQVIGTIAMELRLDLTSGPGAGTIQVLVTQSDQGASTPSFSLSGGFAEFPSGANATISLFGGNSNIPFDTSNTIASGTYPFTSFTGGRGNTVNPYSFTLGVDITAPTTGTGPFNYSGIPGRGVATARAFPEPSSIASLGIALTGVFLFKKRLKGLRAIQRN